MPVAVAITDFPVRPVDYQFALVLASYRASTLYCTLLRCRTDERLGLARLLYCELGPASSVDRHNVNVWAFA